MGERRGGGMRHYSSILTMENKKDGEPLYQMLIKVEPSRSKNVLEVG